MFAGCFLQVSAAHKFSVSGSGVGSLGETHCEGLPGQCSDGKDLCHSVSAALLLFYTLQPNVAMVWMLIEVVSHLQRFQWSLRQCAPVDRRGLVCAAAGADPLPSAGLP